MAKYAFLFIDDGVDYQSDRAELLRELGRAEDARLADRRALELTENPAERTLLQRRLS